MMANGRSFALLVPFTYGIIVVKGFKAVQSMGAGDRSSCTISKTYTYVWRRENIVLLKNLKRISNINFFIFANPTLGNRLFAI